MQATPTLRALSQACAQIYPTFADGEPLACSSAVTEVVTMEKNDLGAVKPALARPEGAGQTLLESVTLITAEALSMLSDADLQRYIKRVADRLESAHKRWKAAEALWQAEDCFAAKGDADREQRACGLLWRAEQAALHEQWKRPHLVTQRLAEIEARIAAEPGAERV